MLQILTVCGAGLGKQFCMSDECRRRIKGTGCGGKT